MNHYINMIVTLNVLLAYSCKLIEKEYKSVLIFQGNKLVPFIKITVAIQRLIAPTKRLLEGGHVSVPGVTAPTNGYKAFEANIDFEIR